MNVTSRLKDNKFVIVIAIIILVQCSYMIWNFAFEKKDFHSDEIWSYGFANSSNGAHLYMSDDNKEMKNMNEWVDDAVLKDYITIDKSEIFNYKMVYDNCAADIHPPFYFMILHFISSLFPGRFSGWFAFCINIFAFILAQIFLYRLIMLITKDKVFSVLGILFYGFTMAAVNNTIYLRNYSLCSAFLLMFLFYSTQLYYNRKDKNAHLKYLLKSGIVCLVCCLTVHMSLVPLFAITLTYCLFYLFSGNWKLLIKYGIGIAFFTGLSFIIFLPTYFHIFIGNEGGAKLLVKYPASWQFKIYWSYLNRDIVGFHNSVWPQMTGLYVLLVIIGLLFLCIPMMFVFRNEMWLKNLIQKCKDILKKLWEKRKDFPYPLFVMFVAVNFTLFINSYYTSIYEMSVHARRYMFLIYAFYACFILSLIYYPIKWIIKKDKFRKIATSLILIVFLTVGYAIRCDAFYFKYEKTMLTIDKIEEDANVVLFFNEPFLIVCVADKIMDKGHYYLTHPELYDIEDNYLDSDIQVYDHPLYLAITINALSSDEDYELAKESGASEEILDSVLRLSDVTGYYEKVFNRKAEYVGTDVIFGRAILIYRLQ